MALLALPDGSDTDTIRTERLEEVVVTSTSARQRLQNIQTGAEQLQLNDLKATPQLFGENDIMRSIQLLPGIKAESDASSSFQVRGGTSAQNLILFDSAPVYNVGHLAGLFSTFNDDALGSATLYKGLLPAQYGGASSAVLDISGRAGDKQRWHGGATIGLLSAKATIEGPIVKDKLSLLVTARRSYLDAFLKLTKDFKDNTLYFYDVNAKIDWNIGPRDQVFLSFFTGKDRTALGSMVDIRWSNLTTSLKWLHHFRGGSNAQTTLLYSGYDNNNGVDFLGVDLWYKGHIHQGSFRQDFNIALGRHELKAGRQSTLLNVKSAEWQVLSRYNNEQRRAWENAAWLNANIKAAPWLTASAGLRFSSFSPLGGSLYYDIAPDGTIEWYYNYRKNQIVRTHIVWEPRASLNFSLSPYLNLKMAYARTSQNIHALRNQSTTTPFDRYAISSNIIEPEIADQVSAGLFAMTPNETYDFSVEGYFRKIKNVLDYRDGKTFRSEIEIERLVLPGEGKAYGVEFLARKNSGRLTGWLGYTLSWSRTRIDGINGGNWYDANNDRRHDINIVVSYQLSRRWSLNAAWVFNSGQAFTAPSGKYQIIDNWIYYYAERNGYRAPDYHRLDVSAVLKGGKRKEERGKRKAETEWVFGIYNLYNRYNPFLINFEDGQNGARTKAKQYSLFGIVPSVSFNVKW